MSILGGGVGRGSIGVTLDADSASGDAFGRLRVATPTTLFESTMVYDLDWVEYV